MPDPKDAKENRQQNPEQSRTNAEPQASEESRSAVNNAVQEFSDLVKKYGGSYCDRFVLTALLHEDVQKSFARHIEARDIFIGVQCVPSIPEEVHVLFDFRCAPPRICFLPVRFLVVLDAYTGRLIRIVDPYNSLVASHDEEVARSQSGMSRGFPMSGLPPVPPTCPPGSPFAGWSR